METNRITMDTIDYKCFSEEELADLGYEYTFQNFSKYMIFKKEDEYFLMDEVNHNQFRVQFNFTDKN